MDIKKIGVIGAGSWGRALAGLLAQRGTAIALWGHDARRVEELRGAGLAGNIRPTSELGDLADADLLLFVTPSRAAREVAEKFAGLKPREDAIFLSCIKGIEQGTGLRMSEVLEGAFPGRRVAVLSGPNLAAEVARKMPTAAVVAARERAVAEHLQGAFSGKTFRVYTSDDVAGVELGGALKNIFAIAAGASDGLGFGDNSKAALMTRGLAELIRLGVALGGRRETFQGLSGVGDLMVTCFSGKSRNRGVGERLGRGEAVEAILGSMEMVAEGVPTTRSAYECARRLGVGTPIIDQLYAVLYEGKAPRAAMMELLGREPRPEED